MPHLQVTGLTKRFADTVALHPTDLDVEQGEFITLLGPSGCGKSTFLRMLMGITTPSGGEIRIAGTRIDRLPPEKRNIAMVFQSYALFPHMSVLGNLAFGLKMKKVPKAEQTRRIAHAVRICNLDAYVDRMPRQLSGGQQQRVALARAIVMEPDLLLFDEPLSNLDAKLRESLREDLLGLHRRVGGTSLYVTHDQDEAMAMSDRIVVMNEGRVVESGTPFELYRAPRSRFTARFLGRTSLIEAIASGNEARLPWGGTAPIDRSASGPVSLSIRPEDLRIEADTQGAAAISGHQFLGAAILYSVKAGEHQLIASATGHASPLPVGSRVSLHAAAPLHVLDAIEGEAA
ncbi:ABC transporter ATP-binding protein [Kaistia dalseonensis]|uniref:Spermidine/putrescine transport system ATP-binding protein n=1 Tax=Kaistia dalseonensis TaxID=410840 RepID=A0ABU0H9M8_9HYPH|nr:ABC transporter ATP-binding protein [Kaistia dalseonensis]MCX5496386.1 ABC transporter ATP-binding protein [Kaistia dalseonensis]MDQ0439007.1 putative spermidine/putrescine transport system ATP-binding protein [Kaistia dalseonensis]